MMQGIICKCQERIILMVMEHSIVGDVVLQLNLLPGRGMLWD